MERKIANRYRLVQVIGRGGMGEVYEAEDELLRRTVAIKKVTSYLSDPHEFASNHSGIFEHAIMNEAQMMARVQHPNIIPIYDLLEEDETHYIVMPLVSSRWINDVKQQPLSEIIRFLERIADGLDFLHRLSTAI